MPHNHPDATTAPLQAVDLRALARAIGRVGAKPPRSSTPRPAVEVIDPDPRPVDVDPVPAVCYIDGCETARTLTYREGHHRPLTLWWTSAAALSPGRPGALLALEETLALSCSYLDADWAENFPGGVEVRPVDAAHPWDIEAAIANLVDEQRRASEIAICETVSGGEGVVLVDGDLRNKSGRTDLVACAKKLDGVYLWDETSVFSLPEGWRSPILRLSPGRRSDGDRFTAYVRLWEASQEWWGYALVRVETRDPALIDGVASLCLANRQPIGSDPRENQLASIAAVEAFLKARRPYLLTL